MSKNLSDDSNSDYDVQEAPEQPDDFFVEELSDTEIKVGNKKDKGSKDRVKLKEGRERPREIDNHQEASRAELELLFAAEHGIEKGPKGYYKMNSKKIKGKKVKEIAPEDKLQNVDCSNDRRFLTLLTNHLYALDPTDPQYKRNAAFARQRLQVQNGSKDALEDSTFDNSKQSSLFTADDVDLVQRPEACLENEKLYSWEKEDICKGCSFWSIVFWKPMKGISESLQRISFKSEGASIAHSNMVSASTWHNRLGHLSSRRLEILKD